MIGFFDSGVGGLTIEQEVIERLPSYSTIYLGDSARSPYGEKTHDELAAFTWQGATWLFDQGCELVIVACNSASAQALRTIQQTKLPANPQKRILGVIRPTVEELAKRGFKKIVVLSTTATKKSEAYVHELKKLDPTISVTSFACPTWGPMIESGKAGTDEMRMQVEKDIAELQKISTDFEAVLLACTHYPYVKEDVERALPGIPVFDQGSLVAISLEDYLKRHPEIETRLKKDGEHAYFTTGDTELVGKIATDRFGFDVSFSHVDLSSV